MLEGIDERERTPKMRRGTAGGEERLKPLREVVVLRSLV
jgi:hypothetical protein